MESYCDVASNTYFQGVYVLNRQCDADYWIYKILPFLKNEGELTTDDCYYGFKLNACEAGYCDPDDDEYFDDDDVPRPAPSPTSPHSLADVDELQTL